MDPWLDRLTVSDPGRPYLKGKSQNMMSSRSLSHQPEVRPDDEEGGKTPTKSRRNKWAGAPAAKKGFCCMCCGQSKDTERHYGKLSSKFIGPAGGVRGSGDCGSTQENYIPIDARDLMTLLVREIPGTLFQLLS